MILAMDTLHEATTFNKYKCPQNRPPTVRRRHNITSRTIVQARDRPLSVPSTLSHLKNLKFNPTTNYSRNFSHTERLYHNHSMNARRPTKTRTVNRSLRRIPQIRRVRRGPIRKPLKHSLLRYASIRYPILELFTRMLYRVTLYSFNRIEALLRKNRIAN